MSAKRKSETPFKKWWKKNQPTDEFVRRRFGDYAPLVIEFIHDWSIAAHGRGMEAGRRAERPIKWMTFKQAVKTLVDGDLILAAHYPWPDNDENIEFAGGTFSCVVPSGHILCKHGWSHQLIYSNRTIAIARIGSRNAISFKGRRAE